MQASSTSWSIRKAVYVGHLMITVPCAILFTTPWVMSMNEYSKGHLPLWIFVLAFVTGLSISWLYWGLMVTHWRILAYTKVKNVEELKRQAIKGFLIWPDSHWLVLAEFRTPSQRKKLRQIDRKLFAKHGLKHKDALTDTAHPTPHRNIHIHYKTGFNFMELVFTFLILFAGIVLLYAGENFLALVFILIGIVGSIYEFRQFYDRGTQIEISNRGLYTLVSGFVPWSHVVNAEIKQLTRGKRENDYLVFTHREATNKEILHTDSIELTEFAIDQEAVKALLKNHLQAHHSA